MAVGMVVPQDVQHAVDDEAPQLIARRGAEVLRLSRSFGRTDVDITHEARGLRPEWVGVRRRKGILKREGNNVGFPVVAQKRAIDCGEDLN